MKPYAWINVNDEYKILFDDELPTYYPQAWMPLYTHPAKTEDVVSIQQALEYEKIFEEGRQLGMLQERALWNLTESTQEIENFHPAKTLTDEEIQELALCDEFWISEDCTIFDWHKFAKAILKKAQGEG
jgi:hypothetical protein